MEQSEQLNELAVALAKAQAAIAPAAKDKVNPAFRSKYADLSSVWEACRKALTDNGLSVVQLPVNHEPGYAALRTMLLHTSGQFISTTVSARLVKDDAQGLGSALTYLRRYSLAALVGVVADEDDDGNAASNRPQNGTGSRQEPQPRQQTTRGEGGIPAAPRPATQAQAKVGSAEEAEAQFYAHYGEEVGGGSWSAVQRYLGHLLPRPTSVEAWREVAKEIVARQRAQKESA
jgi:hypothetical protein